MRKLTTNKPKSKAPKLSGFVLYDGPSVLDGQPIVAIATLSTANVKTGPMAQVWILRADVNPVLASKTGDDVSICGTCVHRHNTGGSCYVNIGQAPNSIYKSYHKGNYATYDASIHADYFVGRKVRLGAYGDPAAVPFDILNSIAKVSLGHTGYTHQIRHVNFDKRYLTICQVSADSPKQALKYQSMGAKTFRVAMAGDALADDETECLADSKGIQCADCLLFDGNKRNIAITVLGSRAKNFKTSVIQTIEVA